MPEHESARNQSVSEQFRAYTGLAKKGEDDAPEVPGPERELDAPPRYSEDQVGPQQEAVESTPEEPPAEPVAKKAPAKKAAKKATKKSAKKA